MYACGNRITHSRLEYLLFRGLLFFFFTVSEEVLWFPLFSEVVALRQVSVLQLQSGQSLQNGKPLATG